MSDTENNLPEQPEPQVEQNEPEGEEEEGVRIKLVENYPPFTRGVFSLV